MSTFVDFCRRKWTHNAIYTIRILREIILDIQRDYLFAYFTDNIKNSWTDINKKNDSETLSQ